MEEDCSCKKSANNSIDVGTPKGAILTAFYKRSIAYHALAVRMPVIITNIIDTLVRHKYDIAERYKLDGLEDLKLVIGFLSKLKYEIQTNKPMERISTDAPDAAIYNAYLKHRSDQLNICNYFNTVWLHAQCFMYRKIRESFELTKNLKDFDPFVFDKEKAFTEAGPLFKSLGEVILAFLDTADKTRDVKADFIDLLRLNLWANKCDLSFSAGMDGHAGGKDDHAWQHSDLVGDVHTLNKNILCDSSEEIWDALNEWSRFQMIDIILDNSGYELFADMCLADFLITHKLCDKVRFYVKTIPWFISDVMKKDFHWQLNQLKESSNETIQTLADRWLSYMSKGAWTIEEELYWTLPVTYVRMVEFDEMLYRRIARSKLVIFKGDLNYRKLFGETNWPVTTTVEAALQGFHPTKVAAIRTLKGDMVCGLPEGIETELDENDKDWKINGEYGVMQFCGKVVRLL